MAISVEQAIVYRGGGRRWFTKRAAAKAEAKGILFRKYPCDCSDDEPEIGYGGETCYVHGLDYFRFHKLIRRLARVYLRAN